MLSFNGSLLITGPLTIFNILPIPLNFTTGDFIISAAVYECGDTVQNIILDDSLVALGLGPGRWILIKAGNITGWAGANITVPSGLTVNSVGVETIDFDGTPKECVVVSLS